MVHQMLHGEETVHQHVAEHDLHLISTMQHLTFLQDTNSGLEIQPSSRDEQGPLPAGRVWRYSKGKGPGDILIRCLNQRAPRRVTPRRKLVEAACIRDLMCEVRLMVDTWKLPLHHSSPVLLPVLPETSLLHILHRHHHTRLSGRSHVALQLD